MSESVAPLEKFQKTWRGEIRSSEGFSVRLLGVTGLLYKDAGHAWRLDCETMTGPEIHVVLYVDRFPDELRLERDVVVRNIKRALAFAGWRLDVTRDA